MQRATLAIALALLWACPAFAQTPVATAPAQEEPEGISPRYLLMNPQGRAVITEDFPGRFQLVTFGFSSCPDVCPTTLLAFKAILAELGEQAPRVVPIFITVDPERDTVEVLRAYTNAFDPRIIGLTGPLELVKRAAERFRFQFEKVREPGAAPDVYTMNHTAGMVLLDGQGNFLTRFAYEAPVHDIVLRIRSDLASTDAAKSAAEAARSAAPK